MRFGNNFYPGDFFAVEEQQLRMVQKRGLFWVAFLVWRLLRLWVACQKVLESAGK